MGDNNWGLLGMLYQALLSQQKQGQQQPMIPQQPATMGRGPGTTGSSFQPSAASFRTGGGMPVSSAYEQLRRMGY